MSDEAGTSCGIAACGVSIDTDGTHVFICFDGAETDKSFEFTMPKDLAMHMANAIQKLAGPTDALSAARCGTRP